MCDLQEEMRQAATPAEPVQYYFTLAQQPGAVQVQGTQQAQQPGTQTATTIQPGQIIIAQPQQGQVLLKPHIRDFFISFFSTKYCHCFQLSFIQISKKQNKPSS